MGRPKGSWRGLNNPRYNGGRYRSADGYVFVYRPLHPNADARGYVREHRMVLAQTLDRPMGCDEVGHHKNAVRDDNAPDNLDPMSRAQHASLHHTGLLKPASLANLRPMTSERARELWRRRKRAALADHPQLPFDHHGAFPALSV